MCHQQSGGPVSLQTCIAWPIHCRHPQCPEIFWTSWQCWETQGVYIILQNSSFFGKVSRLDHTGSVFLVWQQCLGAGAVFTSKWQGGALLYGPRIAHVSVWLLESMTLFYVDAAKLHRYLRTSRGILRPVCPCPHHFLSLPIMNPGLGVCYWACVLVFLTVRSNRPAYWMSQT